MTNSLIDEKPPIRIGLSDNDLVGVITHEIVSFMTLMRVLDAHAIGIIIATAIREAEKKQPIPTPKNVCHSDCEVPSLHGQYEDGIWPNSGRTG